MQTFSAALWGWLLAIVVASVTMALMAAVAVASYTPAPPPPDLAPQQSAPEAQTVPLNWPGIPDGLTAGRQFRLLFVTLSVRAAGSTNIEHYNTFVQADAAASPALRPYAEHFRVVGSTADTAARDNIDLQPTATGVPIYWHTGAKLADDYADFWERTAANGWEGTPKFRDGSDANVEVATGTLTASDTPEADRGTRHPTRPLGGGGASLIAVGSPAVDGQEITALNVVVSTVQEIRYYAISPVFTVGATEVSPPAAPSFAFVEPGGAKQLRMLWTLTDDGGHNISHFELQRSTDRGNTWEDAGLVPPVPDQSTIWYDSGLGAGATYTYRVRAIADGGYEGAWPELSGAAATLATAAEIPAAPDPPTMSLLESGSSRVSWTAPTETGGSAIASYNVRRRPAGCDQSFATIDSVSASVTQYDDIQFGTFILPTDEGVYLYSVQAVNADGELGAWSLDGELRTNGTVPVLAWKPAFCPAN